MGNVNLAKKCKVNLFIESHNDDGYANTLINTLLFFKENGYNVMCLETFHKSKEEYLDESKLYEKLLSIPKLCLTFHENQKICDELAAATKAKIELVESLSSSEFQYCAMDTKERNNDMKGTIFYGIDNLDHRDVYMANTIEQSCETGNVLGLVGFGHYPGIRKKLLEKGFNAEDVRGYFMPKGPIPEYSSNPWYYERKIRSSAEEAEKENIAIIDLYKDSSIDTTAAVIQDYSAYLTKANNPVIHDEL